MSRAPSQAIRIARLAVLAGCATCLAATLAVAGPTRAEADSCQVYAYIDGSGRLVKTVSREAVPPAFQSSLMTFDDCEQARELAARGGREIKAASEDQPTAPVDRPASARTGRDRSRADRLLGWFAGLSPFKGIALILCWAVGLAGGIGVLVTAFKTSIWWGLGCLIVPFVSLIFVILHWRRTWPSFMANLVGGLALGGLLLAWSAPLLP